MDKRFVDLTVDQATQPALLLQADTERRQGDEQ
jgi:hypothetical protein